MRISTYSKTANVQLKTLLALAAPYYSAEFLTFQATRVFASVNKYLLTFPEMRPIDPVVGLRLHFIPSTPFCVGYDFDDDTVRIHIVQHRHAQRHHIHSSNIEW